MDPEEVELQNDYRYRNYAAVIEKALRNFESSSEWADLISSLGKLIKVCNHAICGPGGINPLKLQHLPSVVCITYRHVAKPLGEILSCSLSGSAE